MRPSLTGSSSGWTSWRGVAKRPSRGKGIAAGVLALCLPVVAYFEGYVPHTYADPIGIPTSCYGHVGPENTPGRRFTEAECRDLLAGDLAEANAIVHRCISAPMRP